MEWYFLHHNALGYRPALLCQQIQTIYSVSGQGKQQQIELVMFGFSWMYFLREGNYEEQIEESQAE